MVMHIILKITSVILILYSLLAGMLIPLGMGVVSVSPEKISGGEELSLQVKLYNAQLSDINRLESRIRLNPEQALCSKEIVLLSEQELLLKYDVPAGKLPMDFASRKGKKSPFPILELIDHEKGYVSLESVIFIEQTDTQNIANVAACSIEKRDPAGQMTFPYLNILNETIRNLFYHVPMWFAMIVLMFFSVIYSIKQLNQPQDLNLDAKAASLAAVGVIFGLIGIATGAMWANYTWGAPWSFDVKQNTSAIALLIYLAYFVLRSSFEEMDKKARISAIYNIFAFAMLIPLLYIIPRLEDSLHPGMGNNPAFKKLDLDNTMRMVFYPAVIGWILFGIWMAELAFRIEKIKLKRYNQS